MNKNNKSCTYAEMNIIPSYKWLGITQGTEERCMRYLAQQVLKVAKAYNLSTSERDELAVDMTYEVRLAIWQKFDPKKSRYVTFFSRVLHKRLVDWQRKEMYHRNFFAVMSPAREGEMNAVADLSPFGDVFEIVARRDDVRNVHRVLRLLSPESRRMCELYMETHSLREVARRMGIKRSEFFGKLWPACQSEFKKNWEKFQTV